MTSISSSFSGYPVSRLKISDLTQLKAVELSEDQKKRLKEFQNMVEAPKIDPALADNHESKIYAKVMVNGEAVATIYNGGSTMTSNAAYGRLKNLPSMGEDETSVGPELAQKRAHEIAKALGGTIELAATAQNQAQWMTSQAQRDDQLSAFYAAMDAGAKTKSDAQMIAQGQMDLSAFFSETNDNEKTDEDISTHSAAVKKFMDFMQGAHENPGGFFRAQYLASKGLTEEDVAAMSPEDREKLEEEIKELIKKETEKAIIKGAEKSAAVHEQSETASVTAQGDAGAPLTNAKKKEEQEKQSA